MPLILKLLALPDSVLAKAFVVLHGDDWKKIWTEHDKAKEMRSIFNSGTQPAIPFFKWVECIDYLRSELK